MPSNKPRMLSSTSQAPGRKGQFLTGIRPVSSHPNIDEQLKFAQLLKILGTPTWQGGAR